jgi:hypothetical protein
MTEEIDYSAFVDECGGLQEAADKLFITYDAMRLRRSKQRRRAERGEMGFAPVLPGFAVKTTARKMPDGTWVKQARAPGEEFEMPKGQRLKGVSALVDADDRVVAKWIKTQQDASIAAFSVDAIKEALSDIKPRLPIIRTGVSMSALLTDYVVGDHHLNMRAWPQETAGAAWDIKIAENILIEKCDELVERTPWSEIGIFSNLGDFFHANNASNETAKGTSVDVDGRYGKALQVGLRLSVACIEKLLTKHERVIINWLRGNHDSEIAMAAALAIWAWFRNEPRVEINFNPSKFFIHRHGRTMLFSTHGDALKPAKVVEFVASQYPQIWGETTKRYAKFGHVHHAARGGTVGNMVWESFETLAPKDAWHAGEGYQADRSMTAITYHNVTGEWSRNRVSVA